MIRMSPTGLSLLKRLEGCRLSVYLDQAGLPTIGYGHLLTAADKRSGRFDQPLSQAAVDQMLVEDLATYENAVSLAVTVQLLQQQFDALVSFCFNVGVGAFTRSTLLKKLLQGRYTEVPRQLRRWTRITDPSTGKKVVSPGLVKRREFEVALWSLEGPL